MIKQFCRYCGYCCKDKKLYCAISCKELTEEQCKQENQCGWFENYYVDVFTGKYYIPKEKLWLMMTYQKELSEVRNMRLDKIYYDRILDEYVYKTEAIRPPFSYVITLRGVLDNTIIEKWRDGNRMLDFAYSIDMPKKEIQRRRQAHLSKYKGNWDIYSFTVPPNEFEKILEEIRENGD